MESNVLDLAAKKYSRLRNEEAMRIDPETAEVDWGYAQTLDPYGVDFKLPDELRQVGREYFARNPGSDIWVWFGDLPEETVHRLRERMESDPDCVGDRCPF